MASRPGWVDCDTAGLDRRPSLHQRRLDHRGLAVPNQLIKRNAGLQVVHSGALDVDDRALIENTEGLAVIQEDQPHDRTIALVNSHGSTVPQTMRVSSGDRPPRPHSPDAHTHAIKPSGVHAQSDRPTPGSAAPGGRWRHIPLGHAMTLRNGPTIPVREEDPATAVTDPCLPSTLDELAELLDERILVEDHFVDFKKELERGPGANKGLAKDLAAFSIDGGRIFIGVDEQARDSGNPPVVAAVNLSGLKERIDQIARTAVDPPVGVRCTEIHSDHDPSKGVLVVTIPPSAEPPHMADGRPRGRSDTTNYVLSSAEVTAL